MSPIAVLFLRRSAILCLVVAGSLLLGSRLLVEAGLLGPNAPQRIDQAASALAAARTYGATPALPALQAADKELAAARSLLAGGHDHAAAEAASRSLAAAVAAQRAALMRGAQVRAEGVAISDEIDRSLTELETLYSAITPGLDRATTNRLFSEMKVARRNGADLLLAHEQGNDERVVSDAPRVREVLDATRSSLKSARR